MDNNYFNNGHIFYDSDIEKAFADQEGGTIELRLKEDVAAIVINRADAIALARHFNIIGI